MPNLTFFGLLINLLLFQPVYAGCLLFENSASRTLIALSNYSATNQSCQFNGIKLNAIRQFNSNGQQYVLAVDPENLKTSIINKSCISCHEESADSNTNESNPYKKELKTINSGPYLTSNHGLTNSTNTKKYLTVDLCPSRNKFDYEVFEQKLVLEKSNFPVAFSVSGYWIKYHSEELNWIKEQTAKGRLDVVWVNHSYTHPYIKGLKDEENFLLKDKSQFYNEVINQEKYMISNGLTPSVFFRFPGLISDESLIHQLTDLGLIALGSNAWLAKSQKIKPGSIILIHGNGNEKTGVDKFLNYLDQISNVSQFGDLNNVLKTD